MPFPPLCGSWWNRSLSNSFFFNMSLGKTTLWVKVEIRLKDLLWSSINFLNCLKWVNNYIVLFPGGFPLLMKCKQITILQYSKCMLESLYKDIKAHSWVSKFQFKVFPSSSGHSSTLSSGGLFEVLLIGNASLVKQWKSFLYYKPQNFIASRNNLLSLIP